MTFRNLADFARWFLAQPFGVLRPPQVPVSYYELATDAGAKEGAAVTGIVLYRSPPYQVELFSVHATENGASFPEHRHPDVDSIECFLSGDIAFTIAGRRVASDEDLEQLSQDGAHALSGALLRVRSRDWHGARVGPLGGSFLSLQRWRDGVKPTSVALNWIGPPHVSARHE